MKFTCQETKDGSCASGKCTGDACVSAASTGNGCGANNSNAFCSSADDYCKVTGADAAQQICTNKIADGVACDGNSSVDASK